MNISRRVDPMLVRLTRGKVSTLVFTPAVVCSPRAVGTAGAERERLWALAKDLTAG